MKLWILLLLFCAFSAQAKITSEKEALAILGLKGGETAAEVKSAFRKAAKRFHPDVQGPDASAAKFIEAQEAYNLLSRPQAPKAGRFDYDFGQDFDPAAAPPESPRAATDEFTRRFGLEKKSALTPELKPKLETLARDFEKFWASGRTEEAARAFLAFQKTSEPLGLEIFATLVGEKARVNRRAADAMLKQVFSRLESAELARTLEWFGGMGELRLAPDRHLWPELFPETAEWTLSNPELKNFDRESRRVTLLMLAGQESQKKYPRFYEKLFARSEFLRGKGMEAKVRHVFSVFSQKGPKARDADWKNEANAALDYLRGAGEEGDELRHLLARELLLSKRSPLEFEGFVREIGKIQDFSSFQLGGSFRSEMFQGDPAVAAARREILDFLLRGVAEHEPALALKERAEFARRVNTTSLPREYGDFLKHLDSIFFVEHPRSGADVRQQCAAAYARVAQSVLRK